MSKFDFEKIVREMGGQQPNRKTRTPRTPRTLVGVVVVVIGVRHDQSMSHTGSCSGKASPSSPPLSLFVCVCVRERERERD